jgi:small nuclear ribonucleoprotein (snRNP)-like protein
MGENVQMPNSAPEDLDDILAEVSANCLGGQPVPDDLAALWAAQLLDDVDLLDAYEMTLLDSNDEDLFEGFREEDGIEPAAARAFRRMADQVRWVADVFDGSLVGYWVGENAKRTIENSPIVIVDPDGQYELGGRTLAEFLLEQTDPEDEDDFNEVLRALESLHVNVRVRNHEEIWARIDGFDEPNSIVMGYLVEERMNTEEHMRTERMRAEHIGANDFSNVNRNDTGES